MKTCPCCKQAILEVAVTVTAQQIKGAEIELMKFINAHPARNFWVRNSIFGMIVSLCVVAVAVMFGMGWIIESHYPLYSIFLIWIAGFVLWALLAFNLYTKPLRKLTKHNRAVRNAFAIRYKAAAEVLGLTVAWK
jgi:cobalamin biosynthesis protein CobD/CbiB